MKNVFRWFAATLLSAALANFGQGQPTTNEDESTQQPAERSSPSATETARNGPSPVDPARLAERDRLLKEAQQLHADGKLAKAIAKCEELQVLERSLFGEDHDEVVGSLQLCAAWRQEAGNFPAAKRALHEVLAIRTSRLGPDHWETADARQALEEADKRSKLSDDELQRLAVADSTNRKMMELYQQGKYTDAIVLAGEALATRREILGEQHRETATSLGNLAVLYQSQRDYDRARPLYEQALSIDKKVLGEKHPGYATDLTNLAELYYAQGEFARALPLYEQALAICKSALGENHPETATSLNNLGLAYVALGDYARALPVYEQALAIRQEALGEEHPYTAASLNNLAGVYHSLGDYTRAGPLYQQSLAIHQNALGEQHHKTAICLNNLAALYDDQGDYARAIPLYEQSLAIRQTLGAEHPDTAESLNNLATVLEAQGNFAQALSFYEQALAIRKKALGANHPKTGQSLGNLAGLYQAQGDHERALQLYSEALAIIKQALGDNHPYTATSLDNLALHYYQLGDYDRAQPLFEQSLAIRKQVVGENHPDTAASLNNLASLYHARGDYSQALPLFKRAGEIVIGHLDTSASIQSERQQLVQSHEYKRYIDNFVQCSILAGLAEGDAYRQVLARKGAVLRRQRQMRLARAAADPHEERLWNDLQSTATRLATLILSAPAPDQASSWRQSIADLTEQKERLEAELSQRNRGFRQLQSQIRITEDELSAMLPDDVALVDLLECERIVVDQPAGPRQRRSEARLAAFVLRRGKPLVAIDLGSAQPIYDSAATWREQISESTGNDEDAGPELRRLVWEPLESSLNGITTVLISPDGALAGVPWGALPGSRPGAHLLDERAICVVAVPQLIPEILQPVETTAETSLLVAGNVDYGAAAGQPTLIASARAAPRGNGQDEGVRGKWPALAATRPEIEAIAASFRRAFPSAAVTELDGAGASEDAFRQTAVRHRFLHLATHGFFAPPELRSALRTADSLGTRGVAGFHPGLLSGVVMAGANLPLAPQSDDGILTALEVAGLDLRGVDLVTLSACETGLGEVAGGEGILGLQRAFQIAGARTTVASLWKVNDNATRALMTEFYKNIWQEKLPRIEALRQAQLAMLNGYDAKSHTLRGPGGIVAIDPDELAEPHKGNANDGKSRTPPAYWAAFVLSGDWR